MISDPVFTIGYSPHSIEAFVGLLTQYEIKAIADVRSVPFSKRHRDMNREPLARTLAASGISYVFLGGELGARRTEEDCYVAGQARYELIPRLPLFVQGIKRVQHGATRMRLALMCAEEDPLVCHRGLLVCRALLGFDIDAIHIRKNGAAEKHSSAENRLVLEEKTGLSEPGLFSIHEKDALSRAYERRGLKTAFRK